MLAATIPEQSAKRVVTTCGLIGMVAVVSLRAAKNPLCNEKSTKRLKRVY